MATAGKESATSAKARREVTKAKAREATPPAAPSRVGRHGSAGQGRQNGEAEKVVRDTFTMPGSDYAKIAALKQRCLDAGVVVKKSELVRAGLLLLESEPTARLLAAVSAVETVKTGRPRKLK